VSGLSQRCRAISTIENAMPADALRFVEELKEQLRAGQRLPAEQRAGAPGRAPERPWSRPRSRDRRCARAVPRISRTSGTTIFDAETLERVKTALAAIEAWPRNGPFRPTS
jgi:hypothetical protein